MSESTSSPQNEAVSQETSPLCPPRSRCRWKCGLISGLLLGSLAAVVLLVVCRPQYEATASIQIRSAKPDFLVDSPRMSQYEYSTFVNSQLALLRSSSVIDQALGRPEVFRLPIILKQKDKRGWLTRKLQVKHVSNSEIVHISIKTNSEDAPEKIINAVVDSYFNFIEDVVRQTNSTLITGLRVEERRQRQVAQQLQENIRSKTRNAAVKGTVAGSTRMSLGLEQGELLVKEIFLADMKLTVLRAQRKAIIERMEQPGIVPISMLIQTHPVLQTMTEQRKVLYEQREELIQVYSEDDPRIMEIVQQLERIDDRIKNFFAHNDLESIREPFRIHEEVNLFQINKEIRVQEIVLEELTNKYQYHEQQIQSVEQAENVLDVSVELAHLERTNKTLDKIEERILAITTEQRAPGQITLLTRAVPSVKSSWGKAVAVAGIGFAVFFLLPLLCVACCRCCCRNS